MHHLKDILGYAKQAETLNQICDFLKNTDKYVKFGAAIPNGMLILGESGVGKTFMAEALMNDCGRCPFYVDCATCGVKEISKQFKRARKIGFSVVLLDDIDCLDKDSDEFRSIFYELNSISGDKVFVIATADGGEGVAEFLTDEHTLEITLTLELPSMEDEKLLFKPILDGKNVDENLNYDDFCMFLDYLTYPDVERIVNRAMLLAVYEGQDKVTMTHVVKARQLLENAPLSDEFDEETAYHEAAHAAVHMLLGGKANYVVINDDGGGLFREGDSEEDCHTYEAKERRYVVGMAGRAGVEVFFGRRAVGVKTDLKNMSERLGRDMSTLATAGFDLYDANTEDNVSADYNDRLAQGVQKGMQRYYDKAKELLEHNKPLVHALVDRLKQKPYLLSSELTAIYNNYLKTKPKTAG